jgi:hypothetical protein
VYLSYAVVEKVSRVRGRIQIENRDISWIRHCSFLPAGVSLFDPATSRSKSLLGLAHRWYATNRKGSSTGNVHLVTLKDKSEIENR